MGRGFFGNTENISPTEALNSPAVAACTRLLSESVASLPLHVLRLGDEGSKSRATEEPSYPLMHDSPNSFQTSYTWRAKIVTDCILHGSHYSVIDRDPNTRRVRALWPLNPATVTIDTVSGELKYRAFTPHAELYDPSELLHFKMFSLDGLSGDSLVRIAKQAIMLDLALLRYSSSLFQNGAKPGLVFQHPEHLEGEAIENLSNSFEKFQRSGSGKTLVLEEGMTLTKADFSPVDSEVAALKVIALQDIARALRVPNFMIGEASRSTFHTSSEEVTAYVQNGLRPWLTMIESEINFKLFAGSGLFAAFDLSDLLRGNQTERYTAYGTGIQSGFLSVADVRRAENLPVSSEMETLLHPLNMAPTLPKGNSDGQSTGN